MMKTTVPDANAQSPPNMHPPPAQSRRAAHRVLPVHPLTGSRTPESPPPVRFLPSRTHLLAIHEGGDCTQGSDHRRIARISASALLSSVETSVGPAHYGDFPPPSIFTLRLRHSPAPVGLQKGEEHSVSDGLRVPLACNGAQKGTTRLCRRRASQ